MAKTINPVWSQNSAQGFNDGTESGSTTKAAVNTGWDQATDETFLYRILIQETAGTTESPTYAVRLQARRNGTTWFNVTTSSTIVKIVDSSNLTHGDDTTQRIGSDSDWVTDNNWVADTSGDTNTTTDTFGTGVDSNISECEALFAVQIVGDDVNTNDTIEFQVLDTAGGALDNYEAASIFTITAKKAALTNSFTDSINNWSDDANVLLEHYIEKSDNLANWLDNTASSTPLTYSTGDSLNNWDDLSSGYRIYLDYLPEVWANLNDQVERTSWEDGQLVYNLEEGQLIQIKGDNLNKWADGESHNLAGVSGDLTDTFSDTINNWSDDVNLLLHYAIAETDSLNNWNDSVKRDLLLAYDYTDNLNNWNDEQVIIVSMALVAVDNIRAPPFPDPADSHSALLAHLYADSDAMSLDDGSDRQMLHLLTPSDAINLTDGYDRVLGLLFTEFDDLDNWLDNTARALDEVSANLEESHGDTMTFSDARKLLLSYWKRPTDQITLTDGYDKFSAMSPAFADAMSLSDAHQKDLRYLLTFANTLALSDDAKVQIGKLLSFTNAMTLSDGYGKASDYFKTFGNTMTLSDAHNRLMLHLLSQSDQFTLTDAAVAVILLRFSFTDAISLSDSHARLMAHLRIHADSMTLTDGISRLYLLADSFADAMSLSDADREVLGQLLTADDSMTFSDAHLRLMQMLMTYADTMTLSDYATRKRGVEDNEMPTFTNANWPNQNYYIGPFKV